MMGIEKFQTWEQASDEPMMAHMALELEWVAGLYS